MGTYVWFRYPERLLTMKVQTGITTIFFFASNAGVSLTCSVACVALARWRQMGFWSSAMKSFFMDNAQLVPAGLPDLLMVENV